MLTVDHLSKRFKTYRAVNDISFTAHAGEIFGLLGPNGAGKTTTIRVIATVLAATSGSVNVDGLDVHDQPEEVRRTIGVLTADIGVYDRFTARENLRYFGRLYGMQGGLLEQRIDHLIDILDMRHFADRRSGQFSTGMKQKVAIARSIVHDPKVIIFDEPTAGLDVLASQTVIRYMTTARTEGKVVILSTHDMAHAERLCDRFAIMHRGAIIAGGTLQEILKSTNKSSLEEAFVEIVGADAAKQALHDAEDQHLAKKKSKRFKLFSV